MPPLHRTEKRRYDPAVTTVDPTARAEPREVRPFQVVSDFQPAGDQPKAIEQLADGVWCGERFQTLLGITGSGKSATIAWTIEQVQKPTLVLAPNKSLAAQLANEFREFFPNNRVEYFVSYYDYYQPEAYMPSSDTFIEKDASVNDEIDRLRHAATSALLTRRDVIVVASVSAIYGLGSPEEYAARLAAVRVGDTVDQRALLARLVDLQYERNDMNLVRGKFRVRGDVLEIHPAYDETAVRIEFFGDEVEAIVLDVDASQQRISLGVKQLAVDPWTDIDAFFKIGDVVSGVVSKITSFGAFVELKDGIDGLVHISQISEERIEKIKDVLKAGQVVSARVVKIDRDERRLGLSIKAANYSAEELAAETATYEALNRNAGNDMMNLGDILDVASKKE